MSQKNTSVANRNQHYIPRFHLNHFADPSARRNRNAPLWVYSLKTRTWDHLPAKKIGVEDGYYDLSNPEIRDNLDEALRFVENRSAPVVRKILRKEGISPEERFDVAVFVGSMLARVPVRVEAIQEYQKKIVRKLLRLRHEHWKESPQLFAAEIREMTGREPEGLTIDDFNPDTWDGKFEILPSRPHAVAAGLAATFDLARDVIAGMSWMFYESEAPNFFVTSDHPFFMTVPGVDGPPGLGMVGVEATLPLSRTMALCLTWNNEKTGYQTLAPRDVAEINDRTITMAKRFVAAPAQRFLGDGRLRSSALGEEGGRPRL